MFTVTMRGANFNADSRKLCPFRVLPSTVTTSARKYLRNGVFRLQTVFSLLTLPQWQLRQLYRILIRQDKDKL
ncbi:hypothetical protein SAMN00120144_1894 [Hymenobacter roseosalivarius DSM 11622]|uniref:Uncharacterized protein n=1 Tax=Hymenobacter roseosalivarius DSM 11622 TaxID=645990 RepID=A0A1W1VPD0_9BACT|nr:hypothetical protein [Hymenobacter roseosalivarius]SMB95235.1 hypothetical protein SAMN00120144_1894 [Hymenobacter roseosalivarius DSM 11622]